MQKAYPGLLEPGHSEIRGGGWSSGCLLVEVISSQFASTKTFQSSFPMQSDGHVPELSKEIFIFDY